MNALEYIESREITFLETTTAADAYNNHFVPSDKAEFCSWPYFRTKYNNHCKDKSIIKKHPRPPVVVETSVEQVEELSEISLPVRRSVNYMNGDKVPEVPGLMPTGTILDKLLCDRWTSEEDMAAYEAKFGESMPENQIERGGFTRKCADIRAGGAGAGKTYMSCVAAVKAKIYARRELGEELKVRFISGEMRDTEWAKEINTCDMLKELEVDYMLDYVGFPNYMDIFWEAVADGDIVIIDSLPAILSHFKMSWDTATMGKLPTESQFIFEIIRRLLKSVKDNDNNVQVINQANKDGNYKGGTELPHMLSSMSFVKVSGQDRFLEFEKNRNNGKVKRKLYFNKEENGDLTFNEEVYYATYEQVKDKKESLNDFINNLDKSEKLEPEAAQDVTEMSIEEMDERDQAEFEGRVRAGQILRDQAEEEEEEENVTQEPGEQVDLIDSIKEVEAENTTKNA